MIDTTQRFRIEGIDGRARAGLLRLERGDVPTPCFMPVGTQGTVKSLTPEDLHSVGSRIILANTYHLYLRPGTEVMEEVGGLHRFMHWDRPILTDSGGFQVFSLARINRVEDEGVTFQSHIDGSRHLLTPERAVEIQAVLGSDIMMALDECPPGQADGPTARRALERTILWLQRCRSRHAEFASEGTSRRTPVSDRAGSLVRRPASRITGAHARDGRLARSRNRRPVGRRAEGRDPRNAGCPRARHAVGPAPISDGGGLPGGPRGGDPARGGHVRLRGSDPERPQRNGLHAGRPVERQEGRSGP